MLSNNADQKREFNTSKDPAPLLAIRRESNQGGTGPRLSAYRVGGMPQGTGTEPNQP